MTRWKKDETEFSVKLTDDNAGSMICRVPRPIIDILGEPEAIKFVIKGKKVEITPSK